MPFPFLELPAEIREQIYREVLSAQNSKRFPAAGSDEPAHYEFDLSILRTNQLIHKEAKKIFQDNIFIRITTPWEQSVSHINNEGKVPIVAKGERASNFSTSHLHIYVDTPEALYPVNHGTVSMITCLEDLPTFASMWRYSDLNHQQGLNPHLRLRLTIQDPHVPSRKIPKDLQRKLLLPFGQVKGLAGFTISYEKLLPSVQTELDNLRAKLEPSPGDCLIRGFALKESGNTALAQGRHEEALDFYTQAFAAIHITVEGRKRTVYADGYFCQDLTTGPHKGMRADYVRMILRVRLVANIVETYLRLQQYAEAHFWGKRTIVIFRQSMMGFDTDDEDFIGHRQQPQAPQDEDSSNVDILTGDLASNVPQGGRRHETSRLEQRFLDELRTTRFPAQMDMGKIFYRTALAARKLGKMADVRTLIRAASVYLPADEIVLKEKKKIDAEEEDKEQEWPDSDLLFH